jgi:hypothetical protein
MDMSQSCAVLLLFQSYIFVVLGRISKKIRKILVGNVALMLVVLRVSLEAACAHHK